VYVLACLYVVRSFISLKIHLERNYTSNHNFSREWIRAKRNSKFAPVFNHLSTMPWIYKGVDVYIHRFLTSAWDWGRWSASCSSCFGPGERDLSTHSIGGWVCHRAGLDTGEKRNLLLPLGTESWLFGHPACSSLLYWLISRLNITVRKLLWLYEVLHCTQSRWSFMFMRWNIT
jgi:hypothetical protein